MRGEVERSMAWVQTIVAKVAEFFVSYSFEVIGALIILVLGFKLYQWAGRAVAKFLEHRKFDLVLARFAAGTVKGLIIGFAVIVALGKFGITIAPIIAAVGALAFGSSLAIQGGPLQLRQRPLVAALPAVSCGRYDYGCWGERRGRRGEAWLHNFDRC